MLVRLAMYQQCISPREHKKSPTASTVGLCGHALTGQGKENKAIKIYST